ncbi:hypothetical protein L218DRAFT_949055 [Marasmius fiardii PR-910]|nr:hypothetical protein L218DRAFT_949055 [Marasmius fiardii PR-910]
MSSESPSTTIPNTTREAPNTTTHASDQTSESTVPGTSTAAVPTTSIPPPPTPSTSPPTPPLLPPSSPLAPTPMPPTLIEAAESTLASPVPPSINETPSILSQIPEVTLTTRYTTESTAITTHKSDGRMSEMTARETLGANGGAGSSVMESKAASSGKGRVIVGGFVGGGTFFSWFNARSFPPRSTCFSLFFLVSPKLTLFPFLKK